jgi:hypothetical protein
MRTFDRIFAWMALVAFALMPLVAFAQESGGIGGDQSPPLTGMSDEAIWLIIMGVATSVVTALVNQTYWRSEFKLAVFTVMSMITTTGAIFFRGDLDGSNWVRTLLLIFGSGAVFYKLTAPAMTALEIRTTTDKTRTA